MLKKWILIGLMLTFTAPVFAESTIAILNKDAALFESEAARKETERLKSEFGADEQRIRVIEEQVAEIRNRLARDSVVMTQDETESQNLLVNSLLAERQTLIDKLQQIQQQRQQQFIRTYQPVLAEVIQAIVAEERIDILVDAQAVIFAKEALDITPRVLNDFNSRVREGVR